jgi:GT2 family glycosyltransferase
MTVSIAIPTYNRGAILVETIERLLALQTRAADIVIADQTREYDAAIQQRLASWSEEGAIHWIRLPEPSIPHAMNEALRAATSPVVLFLDDDIIPSANLVADHAAAYEAGIWAVAGQVLQPGQHPIHSEVHGGALRDLEFHFNHDERCLVENVMAGNLSVRRDEARRIGGFDENFIGAAYRFETDFARRIIAAGGLIRFEPRASIDHLHLATGGIRSHGDHRRTASPSHSAGDYYFALRHIDSFWRYAAKRFAANVFTRYHLSHPWYLPAKIAAELRGFLLARKLVRGIPASDAGFVRRAP